MFGNLGLGDRGLPRQRTLRRLVIAALLGLAALLWATGTAPARTDEDLQAYLERLRTSDLTPRGCPSLQDDPVNLSGIWEREPDLGTILIRHDSGTGKLESFHLAPKSPGSADGGFEPGMPNLRGAFDGRQFTGELRTHLPLDYRDRCPAQWVDWREVRLTLKDDGFLRGRWHQGWISFDCRESDGEWLSIEYLCLRDILPVMAEPGDTVITLTWEPPADLDVDHYRIYRGAGERPLSEVEVPRFEDIALSHGTAFTYTIVAVLSDGTTWHGYEAVTAVTGSGLEGAPRRPPRGCRRPR